MGEESLSSKISLDTTEVKTALAQMNRDIRLIESNFRASAAGLQDWAKDADGLRMRIEALNKEIGVQEQKVTALTAEYQRVAAEKGQTSRAAQELEIKLNKETETLNKMRTEASKTAGDLDKMEQETDQTGDEVKELGDKSETTSGKVDQLKNASGGIGAVMAGAAKGVAALATAAVAAATAVAGLVLKVADLSGELVDTELKTGIGVERLQELAYVGGQVGTSTDTIQSSMARMVRSVGDANEQYQAYSAAQADAAAKGEEFTGELGQAAASYDKLGVSLYDANGALRSGEEIFMDAIDALGQVENATERDALAMDIFGRSAMELNPLIKAGSDEIARLSEEARTVGAVLGEEDVYAAEAFGDKLESLKASITTTAAKVGIAFLPAFDGMATMAMGWATQLAGIVDGADGDLGAMATGIGGLVTQITGELAAQLPQFLTVGMEIIKAIITAIVTNLPLMMPAIVEMIMSLVQFIVESLPMIVEAGLQILLALVNGISAAMPTLIPTIAAIIPQIVIMLLENLPLLIEAALSLIIAIVEGLSTALPILIEYIPQIVTAIFDAIIVSLPIIIDAAVELVLALIEGIVGMLPSIGTAVGEILTAIDDGLSQIGPVVLQAGKDLVVGLWDGISAKAGWIAEKAKEFAANLVDGIKSAFKIKSPSRVMADKVGEPIAEGVGVGFGKSMRSVSAQMQQALGAATASLNAPISVSGSYGASGMNGGNTTIALGGIQIHIQGNADAETVTKASKQGVLQALRAAGAI